MLVALEPGASLWDLIGFGQRVSELSGVRVDATTRAMLKPRVLAAVEAQAVDL